jgi:hypothetical protein
MASYRQGGIQAGLEEVLAFPLDRRKGGRDDCSQGSSEWPMILRKRAFEIPISSDGPPEPNGQEFGFYEVQDEPLRLPSPATSTDAAASPLAPPPPIDPSAFQDHTSRTANSPIYKGN